MSPTTLPIAALAVAQTLVWAAFYYSFPALLPTFEAAFGWDKAVLAGGFTTALILSAAAAPLIGRLIDRDHGRLVLISGAVLGATMLATLSVVQEVWQFYAVYVGFGLAMAACLYEPCFSFLTHVLGENARRAITWVTLVAGFAGTVSFPGFHYLTVWLGWRGAALAFAAAVVGIAVPLLIYGTSLKARTPITTNTPHTNRPHVASAVRSSPVFWLLALTFLAIAINHGALISLILPLFAAQSFTTEQAVLAASMIGPMQVAGRIVMIMFERRVTAIGIGIGCLASMFAAGLCLLLASGQPLLAAAFVLLQGAGYGVTSILKPVITADLLGRQSFGLISGWLAVPVMAGSAIAPTLAAMLWGIGGTDLVLTSALGAVLIGTLALLAARVKAR